jgi:DNA topoisomerase II
MSKGLENVYQKKELHQHIYDTPDTYVGGCDLISESLPIYDGQRIITNQVEFVPALFNIFNEILVNARDQAIRIQSRGKKSDIRVTKISVIIDESTGKIIVQNDGSGIDVDTHPTEKKEDGSPLWIPEMIFGHLLTSTNYDKSETKVVGGKNGYGAKLTNIFSKFFRIETVDHIRGKKFLQTYGDNMRECKKPVITAFKGKPYTRITWIADFERFGVEGYSSSMIALMKRRVYDIAGITSSKVSVNLNKKKVEVKDFMDYSRMYLTSDDPLVYCEINPRWRLGVSVSSDKFEQISFVNGISTSKGGKHVDSLTKQITAMLKDAIKKKTKREINETYIKNYLKIFVDCMIENPSFDSQTKERLITPASKFGSRPILSEKFIKEIMTKTNLVERVIQFTEFKLHKENKKTDGQKRSKIRDIPKLDDANWAGTRKSEECVLILTEGDSAKTMAISGLSVVGRDRFGVFPLRGKVLNVRDATKTQIMNNMEVTNLKKILGLETGKEYTNTKSLRYGSIMIMTDQDHDGSHIKGLLINLFHMLWPSLLKLDKQFITSMITPIVKVSRGKICRSFYNLGDYDQWKQSTPDYRKWSVKYYKGLGTSSASESREYFRDLKMNNYIFTKETDQIMDLAFKKSDADKRKNWLYSYDIESVLDHRQEDIPIQEFVHRELIHFSNSDTFRSIGSVYDGLKPSQRKILFACLKRTLYKEIKVAQLSGYVSEISAYHHGEASLQSTIVGLAQDFVGSNNLNLLLPNGQFGTRIMGGHDSASARYIHTELNPLVPLLFPKDDLPLLEYNEDDGIMVEPKYYLPIIPMVLVNGMNGIGTGFSTSIPKFSVKDVVENIKRRLSGSGYKGIDPQYRGFRGKIIKVDDTTYMSKGCYEIKDSKTIEITELPIGRWTDDFKKSLDSLLEEDPKKKSKETKYKIIDYVNNSSDTRVSFTITMPSGLLSSLQWSEDAHIDGVEKYFKLTTTKGLSLNNIHLYNDKQRIRKFKNITEIFDEFYEKRYEMYVKRKAYLCRDYETRLSIMNARVRFIKEVIEETVKIYREKKSTIVGSLQKRGYPRVREKEIVHGDISQTDYDYLVKMPLYNFTEEEIERLLKEHGVLKVEYERLCNTTVEEMWGGECDALIKKMK